MRVAAGIVVIAGVIGGLVWALVLPHTAPPLLVRAPATSPVAAVRVYSPDSGSPWNRLHAALWVRSTDTGSAYGQEAIDPLLWDDSRHLLVGPGHEQALRTLDEFLAAKDEQPAASSLHRALLQHDLWAVFDWANSAASARQFPKESRALRECLAAAIGRLALPRQEIERLPDNYAAAVAAGGYPSAQDPKDRARAFLPPDLFDPRGPWVCLGMDGLPLERTHAQGIGGRSVFLVFLRLPAGRQATLDYLARLRAHNATLAPVTLPARRDDGGRGLSWVGDAPQLPVGTQMAQVRQMMLIDDTGLPVPTNLTQSVHLRTYRGTGSGEQDFCALGLSRAALLAGQAGGLKAVGAYEPAMVLFLAPSIDPFQTGPLARVLAPGMGACLECHGEPGIQSFTCYTGKYGAPRVTRPFDLYDRPVQSERDMTVQWKRQQPSWQALAAMLKQH